MRVLITGAAGMLGQDVQVAAARAGHEVVALSRAQLDIADADAVARAITAAAPDAVVNCAAYTKVDAAETDPQTAARVNADGPATLAAAAADAGAWLVQVSTDYVFDGTKTTGPYVESDPTNPRSVYGATKLAGERAVAASAPHAHTIVRSSWLFGAGGPCFPATILRAGAERDTLRVVADQRGCPTFTPDLAAALVTLATGDRRITGVTHVAASGECSWHELATEIVAAAGLDVRVEPCTTAEYPLPAPRPAYSVLRSGRGGPVLRDWHEGLAEYMRARARQVTAA